MHQRSDPHDDATIIASKKRRERRLREEQRESEFDRFESLTKNLVQVPKSELDERRKTEKGES